MDVIRRPGGEEGREEAGAFFDVDRSGIVEARYALPRIISVPDRPFPARHSEWADEVLVRVVTDNSVASAQRL